MATFQKALTFTQALGRGKHNFQSSTYKVALTNSAYSTSWAALGDISQISAGNGYTAGGNAVAYVSDGTTAGVYRPIFGDPADWVASGGNIGPFRTAVLYNDTSAGKEVVGGWDNGSSITLTDGGDPFRVDMSQVNGVLTIT